MLDSFGTSINAKLPLYVSPMQDGRAAGVDTLSMNWKGLDLYAYPTTRRLSFVLRKVRTGAMQDASNRPCITQSNLVPIYIGVSARCTSTAPTNVNSVKAAMISFKVGSESGDEKSPYVVDRFELCKWLKKDGFHFLTVSPMLGFLAKKHKMTCHTAMEITILSLKGYLGSDLDNTLDKILCPIRALNIPGTQGYIC